MLQFDRRGRKNSNMHIAFQAKSLLTKFEKLLPTKSPEKELYFIKHIALLFQTKIFGIASSERRYKRIN